MRYPQVLCYSAEAILGGWRTSLFQMFKTGAIKPNTQRAELPGVTADSALGMLLCMSLRGDSLEDGNVVELVTDVRNI